MKENYSIIMVDDDPDDHYFFQAALKKVNTSCTLTSVYSGTELINLLLKKENYASSVLKDPDVILMDWDLPGLSGLMTLEKIRSYHSLKKIPVHLLSKASEPGQRSDAMELGASGFHTMPATHRELQRIIVEILIGL